MTLRNNKNKKKRDIKLDLDKYVKITYYSKVTWVDLRLVVKSLRRMPIYIVDKLNVWARSVEKFGIREIRKLSSYHDEPLKGDRKGQRSIRLTKAYRVIYTEHKHGEIEVILVEEVHKHDY